MMGWMRSMTNEMKELRKTSETMLRALNRIESMERDMAIMREENAALHDQLMQQSQVIKEHQIFFEKVDAKEREKNLILMGVPEGEYLGAELDVGKVKKILETLDESLKDGGFITSVKRLGAQETNEETYSGHCVLSRDP